MLKPCEIIFFAHYLQGCCYIPLVMTGQQTNYTLRYIKVKGKYDKTHIIRALIYSFIFNNSTTSKQSITQF